MANVRTEEHVKFIKSLLVKEDSFEYLQMSHLKTSAIYWSLTSSLLLLDSFPEIYPADQQAAILAYLERVYEEEGGGFGGNEGAHDSHLLFTLSGIQILTILLGRGNFPTWFNLDLTVKCKYKTLFIYICSFMYVDILSLQDKSTGAFMGDSYGEIDSRFTYCAVASLSLLNRLTCLDRTLTLSYLNSCRNFDGGFGAIPGSESHGGNIFCCVSTFAILKEPLLDCDGLIEWLVWRQLPCGGFNGRPEKLPDVCYSWWILSSLSTLNSINRIDSSKLKDFILKCQDIHTEDGDGDGIAVGGFADRPGDVGDLFHTLFALTGLSLIRHPQVYEEIDPLYCLPRKYI